MHRAGHVILSCFYYGFSVDEIFFRFDLDKVGIENVHEVELEVLFQMKSVKFNSILHPENGMFTHSFVKIEDSAEGTTPAADSPKRSINVRAAFGEVLELAIPIDSLDCARDARLEFIVTIQIPNSFGERWPIYGAFSAELPGTDFAERMWHA
jgi:hypothetical protein